MARPRTDSSQSLLSVAHSTIAALLKDDKTPPEVRARLAVKAVEWCRADAMSEAEAARIKEAREQELREEAERQRQGAVGLSRTLADALAEIEAETEAAQRIPVYSAPVYAD